MKVLKKISVIVAIMIAAALVFSCASSGGGSAAPSEPVEGFTWNFADPDVGINGWKVAVEEFWEHKGTVEISLDEATFGKGMLRMDVDFTRDSGSDWSEPKLLYTFAEPFNMTGITKFTYTIIYNPEFSSKGHFKSKVIARNDKKDVTDGQTDRINATEEMGNGYMKKKMDVRSRKTTNSINNMVFSIAGYLTDYKGPVFFETMGWE
jgi:hypothetical protein